jgi:adenylate kinase
VRRIILLGAPGAGKGTQAAALERRWGVPHISTGDMLRAQVRQGAELGRKAQGYMEAGELVPDDVMVAMIRERLGEPDAREGYILDGFPRTVAQAEALDAMLRESGGVEAVIDLQVPEEEIIRRLSGRVVCPKCDAIYQVDSRPPRQAGVCDKCGTALIQREDDRPEAVRRRVEVYRQQTEPLLEYYGRKDLLRAVDGIHGPEKTAGVIEELVSKAEKVL